MSFFLKRSSFLSLIYTDGLSLFLSTHPTGLHLPGSNHTKFVLFLMISRDFSSNFVAKFWLFPFGNMNSSEKSKLHLPGSIWKRKILPPKVFNFSSALRRVKTGLTFFIQVRRMLCSGQGPSLNQTYCGHPLFYFSLSSFFARENLPYFGTLRDPGDDKKVA